MGAEDDAECCSCRHYRQMVEDLQAELSTAKAILIARIATAAALDSIDMAVIGAAIQQTA